MKRIWYLVAIAAALSSGCIKKDDLKFNNVKIDNWQPDWALPLINSKLTLKNVVKTGSIVTEDADGLYALHYKGDIFSAKASDYIFVPDQHYSTPSFALNSPVTLPSFTATIDNSVSDHFTYTDTSGAQLSHLNIKSGSLQLTINSTFRHNVSVTVTFPHMTNGSGAAFQANATINYPNTSATVNADLTGFKADLTNGSATTHNYMDYTVRFTVAGTGQPISGTDNISATVNMSNIKYSFIDGFLGHYSIPIPSDTIYVGVFDNTLTANVFIRNPKINLAFNNSFGIDVAAKFDHLYGLTNKGQSVQMNIAQIGIAGATTPGQTAVTNSVLDTTNSSVQNMFNPAPNHVIYDGHIIINPGGSSTYNFVNDESTISLVADAELPAWFKIIDFSLQDTVTMQLPEDTSLVQKAQFKMLADNAFPLYGGIQLYFADENYVVLDSLMPSTTDIIKEAPVDAHGTVNGNSQQISTFTMEHDRYNRLAPRTKYALLRGRLKSSGNSDVKIHSTDNMVIKVAFRFTLNVSSTDL